MTHEDTGNASSSSSSSAAAAATVEAVPSAPGDGGGGGVSGTAPAGAASGGTTTMTMTETVIQSSQPEVLRLTLRGRNNVQWDESVVDNEGMGKKSSKRCCIFHKPRAFGESSTDSSEEEDKDGNGNRKIARPKKKEIPDYQRYHA